MILTDLNPDSIEERERSVLEELLLDPVLAGEFILGLEFPPHMRLRIREMWFKEVFLDYSGVSTGKTISIAAIAALRSILIPDTVIGVVSRTLEQGKLVFEYFERWKNKSDIFKNQIEMSLNARPRILSGGTLPRVRFENGSQIRILPPDFARDGTRMRSERWNDALFDEWTCYPDQHLMWNTFVARASRPCPVRDEYLEKWSRLKLNLVMQTLRNRKSKWRDKSYVWAASQMQKRFKDNESATTVLAQAEAGRFGKVAQEETKHVITREEFDRRTHVGEPTEGTVLLGAEGDELQKLIAVCGNHYQFLAQPEYQYDESYKTVERFRENVRIGRPNYGIQSWNYLDIALEWQKYAPPSTQIEMQKENLSNISFTKTYHGVWMKEGETLYRPSLIDACRNVSVKVQCERTSEEEIFVAGIDVAAGGEKGTGDDFAIAIYRIDTHTQIVNMTKLTGEKSVDKMAYFVHEADRRYGLQSLMIDSGGGGLFVRSALRKERLVFDDIDINVVPIVTEDDEMSMAGGRPILQLFSRGNYNIQLCLGKMADDGVLVNMLHKYFREAFERKELVLPNISRKYDGYYEIPPEEREAVDEIEDALEQLVGVEPAKDKQGRLIKTRSGCMQFVSKRRKDMAYALAYGYFICVLNRLAAEVSEDEGEAFAVYSEAINVR